MNISLGSLLFCALLALAPQSQAAETLYYSGESIVTKDNIEFVRHPYILARTSDSKLGTITETIISFQDGRFSEDHSVMVVSGQTFTMTESTGSVTGSGTLTGPAWNWIFLRAEFHMKTPEYNLRIDDFNFFGTSPKGNLDRRCTAGRSLLAATTKDLSKK